MNQHQLRKNGSDNGGREGGGLRRAAPFQVRADAIQEDGTFEGYGSVFGAVDSYGSIMLPGCFKRTLEAHKARGTRPKGLWQHDQTIVHIRWVDIFEDNYGLKVKGQFIDGIEKAREGHILMKAGEVDGLSQGFDEVAFVDKTPDEAASEYGLSFDDADLAMLPESGRFRLYSDVELWEISQVTFQSCAPAKAEVVRAAGIEHPFDPRLAAALAERAHAIARLARASGSLR